MEKIYISGKITGLKIEDAQRKFEEMEIIINASGKIAVNPMKVTSYNPSLTWSDYIAADIVELMKCDSIYMLDCWSKSKGARIEYCIARELGLKIYFQNTN